jgi:hypothetical protein
MAIGKGVKCCNCGGEHRAKSLEWLSRVKETEVAKIWAVESVSNAEAVKRVEIISEGPVVVNHQQVLENLHVKRVDLSVFDSDGGKRHCTSRNEVKKDRLHCLCS